MVERAEEENKSTHVEYTVSSASSYGADCEKLLAGLSAIRRPLRSVVHTV